MNVHIPRLGKRLNTMPYSETWMEIEEKYNELFAKFERIHKG